MNAGPTPRKRQSSRVFSGMSPSTSAACAVLSSFSNGASVSVGTRSLLTRQASVAAGRQGFTLNLVDRRAANRYRSGVTEKLNPFGRQHHLAFGLFASWQDGTVRIDRADL